MDGDGGFFIFTSTDLKDSWELALKNRHPWTEAPQTTDDRHHSPPLCCCDVSRCWNRTMTTVYIVDCELFVVHSTAVVSRHCVLQTAGYLLCTCVSWFEEKMSVMSVKRCHQDLPCGQPSAI